MAADVERKEGEKERKVGSVTQKKLGERGPLQCGFKGLVRFYCMLPVSNNLKGGNNINSS